MVKKNNSKYSIEERKAFKKGLFIGLRIFKKKKCSKSNNSKSVKKLSNISNKPVFKGSTYVNGKFWDTNFEEPVEITKKEIAKLRSEYDFNGKMSDRQIVDAYVRHMRHKYGVFDSKTGEFLHLIGEDDVANVKRK